jgi:hypothetical protein
MLEIAEPDLALGRTPRTVRHRGTQTGENQNRQQNWENKNRLLGTCYCRVEPARSEINAQARAKKGGFAGAPNDALCQRRARLHSKKRFEAVRSKPAQR